jgi:hypothetical protein
MTEHNLFYYPYASFANAQLPLLKVAALDFDKLVLLDPVGASWDTVGADHVAREVARALKDAGILWIVKPVEVLAKYEGSIADAIRQDMQDREIRSRFTRSGTDNKKRATLLLLSRPTNTQEYLWNSNFLLIRAPEDVMISLMHTRGS